MLLKNGEKFDYNKEEFVKSLPKGKGELVFQLAKRYMRERKKTEKGDKRRFDSPTSFDIEPFFNYVDPDTQDTCQIRYFKTSKMINQGGVSVPDYSPYEIEFPTSTKVFVKRNELDLAWFLYHHPRQATSPYNTKEKPSFFYLEDLAKDAEIKANKGKTRASVTAAIWGDDGLKEAEARKILMSYGHGNVDSLTEDQVRVELETRALVDMKSSTYFLTQTVGKTVEIKAAIQEAADLKVIKFVASNNTWNYLENGNPASVLVSVTRNQNRIDRLAEFLSHEDKNNNLEHIIALTKEAKYRASQPEEEKIEDVKVVQEEDVMP